MHYEIMVAYKQTLCDCKQIFAYIISFLKVSLVLVNNANMSVCDKYNSSLFKKEHFILNNFCWKKDDLYRLYILMMAYPLWIELIRYYAQI